MEPLVTNKDESGNITPYNPCPELQIKDSAVKRYDEQNKFNLPDYLGQKPSFSISLSQIVTHLNDPNIIPLTSTTTSRAVGNAVPVNEPKECALQQLFEGMDWIAPKKVFKACNKKYIIKKIKGLKEEDEGKRESIKQIDISESITKSDKNIFEQILNFPNVEFIKLSDVDLQTIRLKTKKRRSATFPNVLWIDISNNKITDGDDIVNFIKRCPKLQSIDFKGNPCCNKSLINTILINFPNINNLNGEIVDYMRWKEAMLDDPRYARSTQNALRYFTYVVMSIPELRYASLKFTTKFDPSIMEHLSLPNAMITRIDVHEFVNLKSLNLSNNNISTLVNSGIKYLAGLISCNLENNKIQKLKDFDEFKSCLSLLHIRVQGNPLKVYRSKLIAKLRNLNGSAALNGIQSIDGVPVSLEEFLHALDELRPYDYQTLIHEKWIRNIERIVGNYYTKDLHQFAFILHRIRTLSLANRGLHQVDMFHFTNVTVLSLRNNFLTKVHNLQLLERVVFLDLSGNKFLEIYTLLEQIKYCKWLRYLMIAHDCWEVEFENKNNDYQIPPDFFKKDAPSGSVFNEQYRKKTLGIILQFLHYLNSLDRLPITYQERIQVLEKQNNTDLQGMAREEFSTVLKIYQASGVDIEHEITVENKDKIFNQLKEKTDSLIKLQGMELSDNKYLNFMSFDKLKILNLSHNAIKSLKSLRIEHLNSLEVLDVSFNKIADGIATIVKILNKDNLPKLVAFSIHDNPCMNDRQATDTRMTTRTGTKTRARTRTGTGFTRNGNELVDKRMEIIKELRRLLIPDDTLKYIDFDISTEDLRNAFKDLFVDQNEDATRKYRIDDPDERLQKLAIKFRTNATNLSTVTSIDLSHSGLTTINLDELQNLQRIDLSFNNIGEDIDDWKHGEIPEFHFHDLETIDFSHNCIGSNRLFIDTIHANKKLRNIGIGFQAKNEEETSMKSRRGAKEKFDVDGRKKFLKKFFNKTNEEKLLEWSKTPFKAIDNRFICPSEVKEALNANKLNSLKITDEIRWNMAAARYYTFNDGTCELPETVDSIDLSNSELTVSSDGNVTFETLIPFINDNITKLSFAHNDLTGRMLKKLKSCYFSKIEFLDVSNNKIDNINDFNAFLKQFTSLRKLMFDDNPICKKKDDYKNFIEKFDLISDVNFRIEEINGIKITPVDRVEIVKKSNEEKAEEFRTKFMLSLISPDWINLTEVDLSNKDIVDITPLCVCTKLVSLNLSGNNITKLPTDMLNKLENLRSLDLRKNVLDMTLDEIIDVLSYCPQLHILYLENSTKNKDETSGEEYLYKLFSMLKGIQSIDHHQNPVALSPAQWLALDDLNAITGWYYPNRTYAIDFSDCQKEINKNDALSLVHVLSIIQPAKLSIPSSLDKLKNQFINAIPSLKEMNGNPVDQYIRHNAVKKNINAKGETVENLANNAANVALAADLVDKAVDNVSDLDENINMAKEYAIMFGTILSKWEIIITFQQILTQIILFIDRIKWPKIYIDLSFLYWILSIDLSFLNFFLDISVPVYLSYLSLFLYTVGPPLMLLLFFQEWNKKSFDNTFTKHRKNTLHVSFYGLFVLIVCSFGLGFIFDLNHVLHVKKFTNNWKAWAITLSGVSLLIVCAFWVFMWYYNKHAKEKLFWSNLNILKQRMSLFGITVLYSPGCKFFVDLIRCDGDHSYAFTDVICLNSWDSITLVHLAAIIFGLTYAIFFPVFFVQQINQGVSAVDKFCGIEEIRKDVEGKKEELKKIKKASDKELDEMAVGNSITLINLEDTKKDVEELKKEAEEEYKKCEEKYQKTYAAQASSYDHPAAYLYNQYSRSDRYTKVIGLLKKLAIMLFTAFFPKGWLQSLTTNGILWLNTIYQFVVKPFIAGTENFLELCAQFGNSVTLLVGESLQNDFFTSDIYTQIISPAILVGIVAALIILFLALVFKYHCSCKFCRCCCCREKDYEYEYEYEFYDYGEPLENGEDGMELEDIKSDEKGTKKSEDEKESDVDEKSEDKSDSFEDVEELKDVKVEDYSSATESVKMDSPYQAAVTIEQEEPPNQMSDYSDSSKSSKKAKENDYSESYKSLGKEEPPKSMKNNIDQMSDYSDSSESNKQVDKSYDYSDSESTKPINSRKLQTRKRFSSSSSDEETF